ncbi:hypothetical protein [Gracilibacillus sp. YIM 98692]|nr:hypothetical protein [Gracilibacillus sp. YIM 98692]
MVFTIVMLVTRVVVAVINLTTALINRRLTKKDHRSAKRRSL